MSNAARHVLEEAMRLPVGERGAVATELLASMDGAPDADAEQAWAAEIEQRALRAVRGESEGQDWASVRADIEASRRRK
jgi:hypothetical protein